MSDLVGPITVFAAFIDIAEEDQVTQLEEYLGEKGVDIQVDEEGDLLERIYKVSNGCTTVYEDISTSSQELEGLTLSIASLFHVIPEGDAKPLFVKLCANIATGATEDNVKHRMKLLGLLLCQFDTSDNMCSIIVTYRLKLASQFNLGSILNMSLKDLKKGMETWELDLKGKRDILHNFYKTMELSGNMSLAIDTLKELLSTYTNSKSNLSETLQEAEQYAKELIVLVIREPSIFIFDDVVTLVRPLKEAAPHMIYELLQIFETGTVSSFLEFCHNKPSFLETLDLNYELCLHKMQLLTLISSTAGNHEVNFSLLLSELKIESSDLEILILEAIKLKLLGGRIDNVNQKLLINNTIFRTFTMDNWKSLHDRLSAWKKNLSSYCSNLETLQQQQFQPLQ